MDEIHKQKVIETSYRLLSNLDELLIEYRHLLDLLRREKEVLLKSDLKQIQNINESKEEVLHKIKILDSSRERYAHELSGFLKLDEKYSRLLDIAQKIPGEIGEKLRLSHAALDLVLKRIQAYNSENKKMIQSALIALQGAMKELKSSLAPSPTYGRNKKVDSGAESIGSLKVTQV